MRLGHVTNVSKARTKMKEYIVTTTNDILDGICTMLDCEPKETIDEIERLLMIERWLFNVCEEPQRQKVLDYLNKFGYKED